MHMHNCTGHGVAVPTVALEGSVQQFTVSMEAKSLSTLDKAIAVFEPVMMDFQQKHNAYKFQSVVSIVFHKAVDPAAVT